MPRSRHASFPAGRRAGALLRALACACLLPGGAMAGEAPVQVTDGIARIAPGDLAPMPASGRKLVRLAFPPGTGAPVTRPERRGPAARLLDRLYLTGKAAGNRGDLYENRDRGHSALPAGSHPQLARVVYDDALRKAGLDYGIGLELLYDAPLIGNSSTALTSGAYWRSLPRMALTMERGEGPQRLFENYGAGQIHVYPEHRDHDPERGDLIPANTPYYLISQGSSGSDQAHLDALAMILAAFRPETKTVLREAGLIAPTVQMVYRRARKGILSRSAYLSGIAHPAVFDAEGIDLIRMVSLANSITPDTVPPMVRLEVVEEDTARPGIDYSGELGERLFDTPSAIARIWRSTAWRRSMVVSAAATRDPNGRPLNFTWSVLQGDPTHTRIEPLTPNGSRARITVEWQSPRPEPGRGGILSPRIDIGVFANNGAHDSAPAFVSILLPRHERRRYAPGPDGIPRIVSLDRSLPEGGYADPALFPPQPWRDDYHYNAAGHLTGWTRHGPEGVEEYDAEGRRVAPAATP